MRMTFRVIFFGGLIVFLTMVFMVVFMPYMMEKPGTTLIAHPYTDEEARGRELFKSNGCNYCHTQYVRAEDTAMGPVSVAGNYVYDNPMLLGSERTGPDLTYIGRKKSEAWEIAHLKDPRQFSPLSIMASYAFLPEEDLKAIAAYLFALGDRVADMRMIEPPAPYAGMTDPFEYPVIQAQGSEPPGWETWTAAQLQDGKLLYLNYCLPCHGCSGNGLGSYGGTMSVTPANFKQEPYRSMPDDQWYWHVSEGLPGTLMPTWKVSMSEEDRWKVIRYIQTIFAQPVLRDNNAGSPTGSYAGLSNPVPLTVEAIDAGKAIFTRECIICHGDAGRGNGPYRDGLLPPPPDFRASKYQNYTDADYFWRISEGLPWTAMPAWSVHYSEEDRWNLVHYVRSIFVQNPPAPSLPSDVPSFEFPSAYQAARLPENVDYDRGREVFLLNCAHCHGLAGDGQGWDGAYLGPLPYYILHYLFDPTTPAAQGQFFAKVTFGMNDTGMPKWGEYLPEQDRWDAVYFLLQSFIFGRGLSAESESSSPGVRVDYANLSSDDLWASLSGPVSVDNGRNLYATYCATCHGSDGQGDGAGIVSGASAPPPPLQPSMDRATLYWKVAQGVPGGLMYPFDLILSEAQLRDVVAAIQTQTPSAQAAGT